MQVAVYSNERFMPLEQPALRTSTLEGGAACRNAMQAGRE